MFQRKKPWLGDSDLEQGKARGQGTLLGITVVSGEVHGSLRQGGGGRVEAGGSVSLLLSLVLCLPVDCQLPPIASKDQVLFLKA